MVELPSTVAPTAGKANDVSESEDQQLVYDRMRERLMQLFGPGGSFRISLGRATDDEGFFAQTVAETVAWEVAASLAAPAKPASLAATLMGPPQGPRHEVEVEPQLEHEALWAHVEAELLIRSTGPDAFLDDVDIVATPEVDAPAHAAGFRAA